MSKIKDLTGQVFNHLTVLEFFGKSKSGNAIWICKCDCGNLTKQLSWEIRTGKVVSCGCANRRTVSKNLPHNRKHGMSGTKFYGVWCAMLRRCYNKQEKNYLIYGGRGIKVCEEWHDFESFYADMFHGYKNNLTLDRINVNGNYEKSNCRWVSMKKQNNNRRSNHYLEYNGEKLTLSEASEKYNISYHTLKRRINNYKWDIERALTEPIHKNGRSNNGLQKIS